MCAINDGKHFFRPMVEKDKIHFKKSYVNIPGRLIDRLYIAMTDSNTVRPAVLAVLLEGLTRLESGAWGNSSHGVTFAYSALQIHDGGSGEIFHRYQDPIMEHIHDAMLQFALAERNMHMVQDILTKYGYNLTHFCDCGCGITRDTVGYPESTEYRAVNLLRSYGESIGAPVHMVATIDELPLTLCDMHFDEVVGYKNIWQVLETLPAQTFEAMAELSNAMNYVSNMKGLQNAKSKYRLRSDGVWPPQPTTNNIAGR